MNLHLMRKTILHKIKAKKIIKILRIINKNNFTVKRILILIQGLMKIYKQFTINKIKNKKLTIQIISMLKKKNKIKQISRMKDKN